MLYPKNSHEFEIFGLRLIIFQLSRGLEIIIYIVIAPIIITSVSKSPISLFPVVLHTYIINNIKKVKYVVDMLKIDVEIHLFLKVLNLQSAF